MKKFPLLIAVALSTFASELGWSEEKTINEKGIIQVEDDDPEMNAAMEKARDTIDEFLAARKEEGRNFNGLLKVYFFDKSDKEGGEHMWVRLTKVKGKVFTGKLISTPGDLKSVKAGDIVTFKLNRISDWLNVVNGKAEGAFSVKLLRSRMGAEERKEHDDSYPFSFE